MAIPAAFATRFAIRGNLRGLLSSADGTSVAVMKAILPNET